MIEIPKEFCNCDANYNNKNVYTVLVQTLYLTETFKISKIAEIALLRPLSTKNDTLCEFERQLNA